MVSKLSLCLFPGYVIITVDDDDDDDRTANDIDVVIIQDSDTENTETTLPTGDTVTTQPNLQGSNGNYQELSQMSYGNLVNFVLCKMLLPGPDIL